MKLLRVLEQLKAEGPSDKSRGICDEIYARTEDKGLVHDFLWIARTWPKHSGVFSFPIEGTAYTYFCGPATDAWAGEKGALRWELVDYVLASEDVSKSPLHTERKDD